MSSMKDLFRLQSGLDQRSFQKNEGNSNFKAKQCNKINNIIS